MEMTENDGWREVGAKCSSGGGCMTVTKVAGVYVIRDTKTDQCLVFSEQEYADHRRQILDGSWPQLLLRLLRHALALAQPTRHVLHLAGYLLPQIRG
jgi:hypothetical protein